MESRVQHRARERITGREPIHVTLRLLAGLPNLRAKARYRVVRSALGAGAARLGLRLVHYSVMSNHLHLIVEAESSVALSRGMQGLQIRLARAVNKIAGRRGRVFRGRFHAHVLRTPREARHALAYVLLNARRHAWQQGRRLPPRWIDPCSSGAAFRGWAGGAPPNHGGEAEAVVGATTWLLTHGWARHGRIGVHEVPGPRGPAHPRG